MMLCQGETKLKQLKQSKQRQQAMRQEEDKAKVNEVANVVVLNEAVHNSEDEVNLLSVAKATSQEPEEEEAEQLLLKIARCG